MIPPAKGLVEITDGRTRDALMGIDMRPRTHEPLTRYLQPAEQAKDGVLVCIHPAADRVNRTGDLAVILDHGSVSPKGIAMLMIEPETEVEVHCVQSVQPCLTPNVLAGDVGIRCLALKGQENGAPIEHVTHDAPTLVMRIVGVAVIRRAERDDRFQRGWAACGNLERIKSTPGNALHPNRPATPGLGGYPSDDFDAVILLLFH